LFCIAEFIGARHKEVDMRRIFLAICTLFVTTMTMAGGAYAATEPAAPAGEPTLVTYTRTGGFAGFSDTVTVDTAGVARASSRPAEITLSAAELDGLRANLDRIRTWWSSPAGCDIADHIAYSITYGENRARRCHVVPRDWQPAVAQLDDLLARVRAGRSTGA
jgi:hypothetical protein